MKKVLIAALLLVGLNSFAQERNDKPNRDEMEKLTPEQRNEKRLKKLTADLDLNTKQQEQVSKIITQQGLKREAMKAKREDFKANQEKPSPEERADFKKQMMDEKTAMDAQMKAILTPEQFAKWTENNEKRRDKMKERMHERRNN
ncbi:Spy/CpxP family protein refolding chaperone [Flavobacterium restrictum]|uniref:LTXXQ motif family protein n=1 Tax=Flavobacterium restrictum TaxID=2594428 RepID=A0A553E4S2_9FLAO|nr:Spy/CpxP family protein refolding chaperone [Flavobacterium restrictum]TRX40039.1 hypothetical protein FNW21_07470 [Flavobacterium restrictum]